jgi:molybdopterin-guanine dinucleotide biosynthesis protein
VKIAFVGKKGSGKTTLASLLVSHLVAEGRPVLAIDAEANLAALRALRELVDRTPRNPAAYQRHAVEFHLRNAASWGNARTGLDLARQAAPDFVPPTAAAATAAASAVR